MYDDPLELKYFDFSEFINSSKTDFIGRQWLYHELELVLDDINTRGVLITGNPGTGKSAFLSNLLCSAKSSPTIHNRILGYHFCMHYDRATQDGTKFVRNLANMVAWKIKEYREHIRTNSFVRRVLYIECPKDPEWCFDQGILSPLKSLSLQPGSPWYIIIDALDECSDDKADILNILRLKVGRLPKWMKLIISSRNVSSITTNLHKLQKVELRSDDKRNIQDIDNYLSLKVFSLREPIIQRITTALGITDNDSPSQIVVSKLAEKGQGNFLYVKVVLDLWLASTESVSWETFPKTLESSYQLYFETKFRTPASFQPLRKIFEVLVAAYTPLTVYDLHSLLILDQPTLDLVYDLLPKLDQMSLFLWHGSGDGPIRIHHSSLSEWLTNESNQGKIYYVQKEKGHNLLAKYYLMRAEKSRSPLKPEEAFHLANHVVKGGFAKFLVRQFLSLPSQYVNTTDPLTKTTALHYSSSLVSVDVTKLLVQHFSDVDCIDNDQISPSFLAAATGHVDHLMALFERGANLNQTAGTYIDLEIASHSYDPVIECKRKKCKYSLLHTASQEGNINVVKFLIQHKLNISARTGTNNTAIQLAAANGHLETVKLLKEAGGILDDIALHHSAAGGHRDVVQFLLREGVKDSCVPNSPAFIYSSQENKESEAPEIYLYDNRHLYLRETALHAAVRKGHLSVIKVLLRDLDESAINCTNSAGRRPQHEATYLNNYNALELLLQSGANANVPCHLVVSSSMEFKPFLTGKLAQNVCPCGFSPLHIAAIYGYYSIAELLLRNKADVNAGDCNGSTPIHVASCHGMTALVFLLAKSGSDVNATSLNGSTPLHSAATCFAKDVFKPLLDLGCDPLAVDNEGMTPLHYVVKNVGVVGHEYLIDWRVHEPKSWIENPAGTSKQETLTKLSEEYPWLRAFIKLVKCVAATARKRKIDFLLMKDNQNRSALVQLEKKTNISLLLTGSSEAGESSFVFSLTPVNFAYDVTIGEKIKRQVAALNKPYEQGVIPNFVKKFMAKTLTSAFTKLKLNCSRLVNYVGLNLVYTANIALQAGLDVNCRNWRGLSPLLTYLHTGGRHMSKVLVKHNVEVEIRCGRPFDMSTFHLVSYHKLHYLHYVYEFLMGSDNWQKYLQTENAIFDYFFDTYEDRINDGKLETVRVGNGPLTAAILSHPNGIKVIDDCFDAEGFNAFHRAAQGANLVAIQKFLSWGANHSIENADGFSSLWISVLYAVKYRPFLNLDQPSLLTALEVEIASFSASAILNHILQNGTFDVGCNGNRSDLTLYHIAASRGMWQFIAQLLSTNGVKGIDVNCPNKDGITPMYLAKFIGGESCGWYSPWCKVVDVIKSYGGTLRYPSTKAEYFLIFNVFFGMNPSQTLFLELTEDEILALQENEWRDECQRYTSEGDVDLLKTSDEVTKVHYDYQDKVDKCFSVVKECPATIKKELPHFSFVVFIFGQQLAVKLSFILVRDSFVAFLDRGIEGMKELLLTATRPHAEIPCKYDPDNKNMESDPPRIDLCCPFCDKQDLETSVHELFRRYQVNFNLVKEGSDEVKLYMVSGGRLPRFLVRMNQALHSYDTMLNCDWRSIAIKYAVLSFQVGTLKYWLYAIHETLTVPSVSDFLSDRMKNILFQPSEDLLKLILELASKPPSEEFSYLKVLRFTKPPMWRGTFAKGNFG